MDFWNKARSFAEEATKRSQELAKDAARRSQELAAAGAPKLSDIVSEASKRADQFRSEALKRTEDLKLFASAIAARAPAETPPLDDDLEAFGVTEELREFVQGITPTTFSDFPLEGTFFLSRSRLVAEKIWGTVRIRVVCCQLRTKCLTRTVN